MYINDKACTFLIEYNFVLSHEELVLFGCMVAHIELTCLNNKSKTY